MLTQKCYYKLFSCLCFAALGVYICPFIAIPRIYIPFFDRHFQVHLDPMSIDTRPLYRVSYRKYNNINISTDANTCACAFTSKIRLYTQKSEFRLGETILVEIELFDWYRRRKSRGGDFVRVWMKEENKNARAAGVITDHNNGTYTGSLKAFWSGSPLIEVSIAGCRETMDIYYRVYRDNYSLLNHFVALFENNGVRSTSTCLPIPRIPGYIYVCNLTSENYDLPLYCGRPAHRKLLCHDFSGLRQNGGHMSFFTRQEAKFFESQRLHQKIPGPLNVIVISDKETVPLPTSPCNRSPLRDSWEASTPVGFFYKNRWQSLTCKNTVPPDAQVYRKCLEGRTLWIHGDSTSRQWFVSFRNRLDMRLLTEEWNDGDKWHNPSVMGKNNWNGTIMLIFHEYPFFHGNIFTKPAYHRATHAYLDEQPTDSKDIIILHLNLHFQPYPPDVYRVHIRRVVKSVKSLVSRAPDIKIAIRGTHAFIGGKLALGFLDDCWMYVYDSIIKEEFKGLEDSVLFLDNIDMTVATENFDAHPNMLALDSLLEHFMGCICDA